MVSSKSLIICNSIHHNNTIKIAQAIGAVLKADIIGVDEFTIGLLEKYDVIGFGSGIYDGSHHKSILKIANKLISVENKKAFIFSTSTIPINKFHSALREILLQKRFTIIGEFSCKGYMNYSFTKYFFGGLNKGRPNQNDIEKSQQFAINLNI